MGEQNPGKGLLSPFETAYQNLKEVMGGLRAKPKADFNHEKSMTKLKDEFSAFKDLKGNPHDEEDDGVDFDPDEEEQPDKTAEPEVQRRIWWMGHSPEGAWTQDRNTWAGHAFHGQQSGPHQRRCTLGWKAKVGFQISMLTPKDHFTTVTRVVAATGRREAKGPPLIPAGSAVTERDPKA